MTMELQQLLDAIDRHPDCVAPLRAVVALHSPFVVGTLRRPRCRTCTYPSSGVRGGTYRVHHRGWPCDTIRAIARHLDIDVESEDEDDDR